MTTQYAGNPAPTRTFIKLRAACSKLNLPVLCALVSLSFGQTSATAEDFFVGDSTVTVTNTVINAGGLANGDSVTFQGNILTAGDGVIINPVPSGLSLLFNASSTIISGNSTIIDYDGVRIDGVFDGSFINYGLIRGTARGIRFNGNLTGSFANYGTIDNGIRFLSVSGTFTNSGTINNDGDSVFFSGDLIGSFTNYGTITSMSQEGVDLDDLIGTLINYGTIFGGDNGVEMDDDLRGTLINYGTVNATDDGVNIDEDLDGMLTNYGTISGGDDGVYIDDDLNGMLTNYGTISGGFDGVYIDEDMDGTLTNSGIIEGNNFGIDVAESGTGTIRNDGGRISGGAGAIQLGSGNGTVVLSGPSHIVGGINGEGGTDVLRFENMRGINAAKQAELAALAAADPAAGTVTLFGESIDWLNFEDIQANAASLVTYQSLVTDPGQLNYASALDNVNGLNDSLRDLLKALNNVDAALLDRALSNASGQSVRNALGDIAREQDTNFFSLFSNQFSSLRGDVSGGGLASRQNSRIQRSGLLTREEYAGSAVAAPRDQIDTWVSSYVGNGRQDANGSRAEADYDNTSFLFGRGGEINENWYLGAFGGYTRNEGQVDGFGSYLENNGGWIGANAQFQNGDLFANFVGAFGFQDIKTIRRDIASNRMQGDTDSLGGFLYSQIGRDFLLGENNDTRVSPYAGMTLSAQAIDAYTEQGPAGTSLRFADQTITTVQSVLGVAVAQYRDTDRGWLRLKADLSWWRSYGDSSYSASLVAPGLLNGFNVTSPGANENRGVLQVGVEFGSDRLENWVFQAGYFGVIGDNDYASHGGTVGARVSF